MEQIPLDAIVNIVAELQRSSLTAQDLAGLQAYLSRARENSSNLSNNRVVQRFAFRDDLLLTNVAETRPPSPLAMSSATAATNALLFDACDLSTPISTELFYTFDQILDEPARMPKLNLDVYRLYHEACNQGYSPGDELECRNSNADFLQEFTWPDPMNSADWFAHQQNVASGRNIQEIEAENNNSLLQQQRGVNDLTNAHHLADPNIICHYGSSSSSTTNNSNNPSEPSTTGLLETLQQELISLVNGLDQTQLVALFSKLNKQQRRRWSRKQKPYASMLGKFKVQGPKSNQQTPRKKDWDEQ